MKDIHANPQFRRENMRSLDGEWEFEILDTPFADNLTERTLTGKIRVPFCPESELSGVGYKGEIRYCAYAKTFSLSAEEKKEKVLLRFGACDYEAHVYLNGARAGSHRGGYSSFCLDVSALVREGGNRLFVLVYDDPKDDCPSGKQTFKESSFGCFYSRVTGIWQSVWLEFVPECYLTSVRFIPDIRNCCVRVRAESFGSEKFGMQVFYGGRKVGECAFPLTQYGEGECGLSEKHLWEVGEGRLYDVVLTYGKDVVHSYFGLRECAFSGEKFLLNGKSVFQRLVLDQGYHPKGLYTVPTEEEMRDEIGMATALGFNGARLHQKVFEPQFLYECDKAGYLVWEELPSWGVDYTDLSGIGGVLEEWREIVGRDVNHPCIVTWCPANEFWTDEFRGNKYPRVCDLRYVKILYAFTKMLDDTRPCVDSSGGYHTGETDLYDFHTYDGIEKAEKYLAAFESEGKLVMPLLMPEKAECRAAAYRPGQPVMASEYGGIAYDPEASGWGYAAAATPKELAGKAAELSRAYMNCPKLSGMCYTQLYDVEQEKNGLYYYDRTPKMNESEAEILRKVLRAPAKIEKE